MSELKNIFVPLIVLQMLLSPVVSWPRNQAFPSEAVEQSPPIGPVEELEQLKKDILGEEVPTCNPFEQNSNDFGAPNFDEAMASMMVDPFGGHLTFPPDYTNECAPEIVEGAFHRLPDEDIMPLYKRALDLKRKTLSYIVDIGSYDREQRRELLRNYMESVLFPMRSLIVKKRTFPSAEGPDESDLYENLLPDVPRDLVDGEAPLGISYEESTSRFNVLALQRDVLTLASNEPTADHYVQAQQLQSLLVSLRQMRDYDIILGAESKELSVPEVCRPHLDGVELVFPLTTEEESRKNFLLESLLVKLGLVSHSILNNSQIDSLNLSHHEMQAFNGRNGILDEDIKNTPIDDFGLGDSFLSPSEEYFYAQKGLNLFDGSHPRQYSELIPDMGDNRKFFDRMRTLKEPESHAILSKIPPMPVLMVQGLGFKIWSWLKRWGTPPTPKPPEQYNGIQVFRKLFPSDAETGDPYSPYINESMEKKDIDYFMDLISPSLKEELESQKVVFEMPSLYSPRTWRRWGMESLAYFTGEAQGLDEETFRDVKRAVTRACRIRNPRSPLNGQYRPGINRFCSGKSPRETLEDIHTFIETHKSTAQNPYLSTGIDESTLESSYPFLRRLWRYFNQYGSFHRVDMSEYNFGINEYDFLYYQITFGNPWAVLRLGYLLAVEDIKGLKTPLTLEDRDLLARLNEFGNINSIPNHERFIRMAEIQEFNKGIDTILKKFQQAASIFGVDKPLSNGLAEKILTLEEKKGQWNEIIYEYNRENHLLLSKEIDGRSLYDYVMELSSRYFFSKEDVREYLENNPTVSQEIDRESTRELNAITLSYEEQMLSEIYKATRDGRKLNSTQEVFITENPSSVNRSDEILLELDTRFKLSIFQSLLRKSSSLRREDIVEGMEVICSLNPEEHGERTALFYGTLNIQNELNRMIGLPEVPQEIQSEIDSMDPKEWKMMWAAGGLMASMMGGIIAYSASAGCVAVTLGLCALILPVAAVAPWTLAASQGYLLWGESSLWLDSLGHRKKVEVLENLHFADQGSSSKVKRTLLFPAIEVAGAVGIVGIVGRALNIVTHMTASSLRGIKGEGSILRTTYRQMETELAQSLLGRRHQTRASLSMNNLQRDLGELRSLYRQGRIDAHGLGNRLSRLLDSWADETFGEVSVDISSVKGVDEALAAKVSAHFHNDPVKMANFLGSYTGRRLKKAQRWIDPVTGEKRPFSERPLSGRIRPLLGTTLGWLRQRETVQNLVKYGQDMQAVRDDLLELSRTGGDFKAYIAQQAEMLTKIFVNLPYRKREMPHLFLIQGSYHHYLSRSNRPSRAWGAVSDGIAMEEYFRARARLVFEVNVKTARERLGLAPHIITETSYQSLNHFSDAYSKALMRTSGESRVGLEASFESFSESIARRVFESPTLTKGPDSWSVSDYRRVLFNPLTEDEKSFSHVIWNSMDAEKIFQLEGSKDLASKITQELIEHTNPREFKYYLTSLRGLLVKSTEPPVIDIF